MKLARALSEAEAKKIQSFILYGGMFTTLTIWTKLEDPINLPKMFVLVLFGAIVLGLSTPALVGARKSITGYKKMGLTLIGIFTIALLVSTLMTDVKYTAIFGEYHRNNGALSYLAMAILFAGSVVTFSGQSSIRYFKFFAITGLLLTGYGFLQAAGKDPVGWKLDYNPFITTLGNPNFTSAFLGLAGVAILLLALEARDRKIQVLYVIGLLADLYILRRSGSIQGLFGFLIGSTIIVLIKLWLINKKLGQVSLILAAIGATPVALAVFNVGPLASKLYQGTLRNRLDYWNAAIAMFKDHPIFGVGIDRFGEYYRQYAVQNQVVQGQITDNAHSVYMQLLATGGLILFIPYNQIQSSDKDQGQKEKTNNGKSIKSANLESAFPVTYVASFILVISVLVLLVPALGKSSTLYNFKANASSYTTQTYVPAIVSESKSASNDPQYLIQLANLAFTQNAVSEAFVMIDQINKIDSRSYYGNYFAAYAFEALDKRAKAIKYRERLKELDPWNNSSLIELIKNHLSVGDKASAEEIAALIKRNFPGSQSDIDASALLVG
jgi:O-antigen ligase